MHKSVVLYSEKRNQKDWILLPSEVKTTRWRASRSRSLIFMLSLCGHRMGEFLSIFSDSFAGLQDPPGEIRVGGSGEFGATQMVPRFDWPSTVEETRNNAHTI